MSEAVIIVGLRWRLVRNAVRSFRRHSRLKVAFVALFGLAFWGSLFGVFHHSFNFFMRSFPEFVPPITAYLFALFFMSLLVMLTLSNGIISYGNLYRSDETAYLLTTPLGPGSIFTTKFLESLVFSSWAMMFLAAPLIVAYGVAVGARLWFYPVALAFFLPFIAIAGAIGTIAAILITSLAPHSKKQLLALLAVLGAGVAALPLVKLISWFKTSRDDAEVWVQGVFSKLTWCRNPLLPSVWASEGILGSSQGEAAGALFYFLVLSSNAAFAVMLAYALASRSYFASWSRAQSASSAKRRRSGAVIDLLAGTALGLLRKSTRLLIVKDLKTFLRDPMQWSQFLIFFGLLAVYILNLRNFAYNLRDPYWRNAVSFLNLAATSLTLATLTSRFIFPLLSLEGKRFWLLGLLPLRRRSIVLGKFLFAFGGALIVSEVLIIISDYMLKIPAGMAWLHVLLLLMICSGLAGSSVGLGAAFPDMREDNPSKIVSGFGGTLNLVVSLVFIAAMVTIFAVPSHLYFVRQDVSLPRFRTWLIQGTVAATALTAVATILPLALGIRAFKKMEL